MKKRNLFVLAFLLALYIVPMILVPTSYHTGIVEQPNTSKEFSSSEYGDESPQSITSFSETLPDDVLFYPDLLISENDAETASTGAYSGGGESGDWTRTTAKDASYWTGATNSEFELTFVSSSAIVEFDYALYFMAVTNIPDLEVWNFETSAWVAVDTPTGDSWCNGTLSNEDYWNATNAVIIQVECGVAETVQWDYAQLTFFVGEMTLADSEHYAESFADVSDFALYGAGFTPTTDGDVMTWGVPADSSYDFIQTNGPSCLSGSYLEIRYKSNATATDQLRIYLASLDDYLGTTSVLVTLSPTTSWQTYKAIITQDVECIRLGGYSTDAITGLMIDYLRISPSTETGWQHDGSTTVGITPTSGDTVSSDGDIVTLVTDVTAGSFEFLIDTTTTASALSCAYYPFLSVNITSLSDGDAWRLWQYDGSAWAAVSNDEGYGWTTTTGLHRYNTRTLDTNVYKFRFNATATALVGIDFIKAYSITNFTYTGTGVSLDDVLYVASGTLYCSGTSITSIVLDHDPTLSVDTDIYTAWQVTTSSGTPQTDYYIDAVWIGYSSETSGTFDFGTLTDIRIKFTASANIESIAFIDTHMWHEAGEAIIYFQVPYDETVVNWLLILLGMILVPVSTVYLAHGGRSGASADKVFYFIIMFVMGWALILGGIYA